MRNLPEYVVAFWGAALNGAIVVPLNSWWAGGELDYALRDAGVTVAFADDERLERVVTDGRPAGIQAHRRAHRARRDVALDDLSNGAPIADDADRAPRPDDPIDHPLHVGHHRPAQGRARSPTGR